MYESFEYNELFIISISINKSAAKGPLNIPKAHNFPIQCMFFSLKVIFVLANSVHPAEMPQYHLGFHYLPRLS